MLNNINMKDLLNSCPYYLITTASPEDIEKWMAMPVIDQIKEDWIKLAKESGIKNPEQIVEKINRIINEVIEKEQRERG